MSSISTGIVDPTLPQDRAIKAIRDNHNAYIESLKPFSGAGDAGFIGGDGIGGGNQGPPPAGNFLPRAGGTMIGPFGNEQVILTIDAGVVDVSEFSGNDAPWIALNPEGGLADDLETLTPGTNIMSHRELWIEVTNASITFKTTGNIKPPNGADFVAAAGSVVKLVYSALVSSWIITSASNGISASGAVSPLTTKGDIWGYNTGDARIPVGATDGHVLTVDSTEALGVKWSAAGAADNLGNHTATEPLDMASFGIDNYIGWTAAVGQASAVDGNGVTHSLPSGDAYLWNVNGAAQLTVSENDIDLHDNGLDNYVGWTAAVGQTSAVSATGVTHTLPSGDTYAWNVNGLSQLTVSENDIDLHDNGLDNYVGWTADVGQTSAVSATGVTHTLPAADEYIWNVNGSPQLTVSENDLDFHDNGISNYVGWTADVGQTAAVDATGLHYTLPLGDTFDITIDGLAVAAISKSGWAFNAALSTDTFNMNSHKMVNVTDPTSAQDVATKAYVDLNDDTDQWSTYSAVTDVTVTGHTIIGGGAGEGMTAIGHLDFVDNLATPASGLSIFSDGTDLLANTGGTTVNLSNISTTVFATVALDNLSTPVLNVPINFNSNAPTNFNGYVSQIVGNTLVNDATGATWSLPTGDIYDYQINGVSIWNVSAAANAMTVPLNMNANYITMDDIAAPANPGAGQRRLFVDTSTGQLSVRTSSGTTVSLESAASASSTYTVDRQGNKSGTVTYDLSGTTNKLVFTATGDCDITLSNIPDSASDAKDFHIEIIQNGTGGHAITFNDSEVIDPPTPGTTADSTTLLACTADGDGNVRIMTLLNATSSSSSSQTPWLSNIEADEYDLRGLRNLIFDESTGLTAPLTTETAIWNDSGLKYHTDFTGGHRFYTSGDVISPLVSIQPTLMLLDTGYDIQMTNGSITRIDELNFRGAGGSATKGTISDGPTLPNNFAIISNVATGGVDIMCDPNGLGIVRVAHFGRDSVSVGTVGWLDLFENDIINMGPGTITNETNEATIDAAADYILFYDDSATALRKTAITNLPGGEVFTWTGNHNAVGNILNLQPLVQWYAPTTSSARLNVNGVDKYFDYTDNKITTSSDASEFVLDTAYNNPGTAADDDVYAQFIHRYEDDAGTSDIFSSISHIARDVSAGSEDVQIQFTVMDGGALTKTMSWGADGAGGNGLRLEQKQNTMDILYIRNEDTPATGGIASHVWRTPKSTGPMEDFAVLTVSANTITNGSEDVNVEFEGMTDGTLETFLEFDGDAGLHVMKDSAGKIGFFDATPVVQQQLDATPTLTEISTALRNLGLTKL